MSFYLKFAVFKLKLSDFLKNTRKFLIKNAKTIKKI